MSVLKELFKAPIKGKKITGDLLLPELTENHTPGGQDHDQKKHAPNHPSQARFEFDKEREAKQEEKFQKWKKEQAAWEHLGEMQEWMKEGDASFGALMDELEFNDAVTPETVNEILDHYDAENVSWVGEQTNLWVVGDEVLEWDGKSNTWSVSDDVSDFVHNYDISFVEDKISEQFSEEFWSGPGPVYHASPEENRESILGEGIEATSATRGMSNRSIGSAVFTSADPEEIRDSYGPDVYEIDTAAMKRDGYTPFVYQEPDIVESEARGSLAHALNQDDFHMDTESGMSPNTIIFDGQIPAKYLRLLE